MEAIKAKLKVYLAEKQERVESLEALRRRLAEEEQDIRLLEAKIEALQEFAQDLAPNLTQFALADGKAYTGLRDAVRELVPKISSPFTRQQVIDAVRGEYPGVVFSDRAVEGPIAEMMADGLIKMMIRGHAKAPSVYVHAK